MSDPSVLSLLFSVDVAHKAFCKGGGGVCGDHRGRKKDHFKGLSLSSSRFSSQFNHRHNIMIVAYIMMIVLEASQLMMMMIVLTVNYDDR